jgi:hypothetical protein
VVGLSFDFVVYNLLGFTCYSIYMVSTALRVACARAAASLRKATTPTHSDDVSQKCAEFWSKRVWEEYREANDGDEVSVQINDVGKR